MLRNDKWIRKQFGSLCPVCDVGYLILPLLDCWLHGMTNQFKRDRKTIFQYFTNKLFPFWNSSQTFQSLIRNCSSTKSIKLRSIIYFFECLELIYSKVWGILKVIFVQLLRLDFYKYGLRMRFGKGRLMDSNLQLSRRDFKFLADQKLSLELIQSLSWSFKITKLRMDSLESNLGFCWNG